MFLAITAFWQASFLPTLLPTAPRPDIILILVVSWSLLRGAREGMIWAGIAGLLLGLLSTFPLGLYVLLLTVFAILVSRAQGGIYRSNLLFPVLLVSLASLAYNLLLALIRFSPEYSLLNLGFWTGILGQVIIPQTLWNTALTILFYPLLRRLHLATGPTRLGW